jgi:hypothetical protein
MEWLIGAFVGKERATAMIGDQLEMHPDGTRFWRSFLMLLVSVAWRPLAALLVAYASIYLTWIPAFHGWILVSRHLWVHRAGVTTWAPNASIIMREGFWALIFGGISMLECLSAMFAYVLYGFRDAMTIVSAILGGLSLALCWYLWSPEIRIALILGMAIVTLALAATREYRRALAVFTLGISISVAFGWLVLKVSGSFHSGAASLAGIGIIPLITVLMISQLHRKLGATPAVSSIGTR